MKLSRPLCLRLSAAQNILALQLHDYASFHMGYKVQKGENISNKKEIEFTSDSLTLELNFCGTLPIVKLYSIVLSLSKPGILFLFFPDAQIFLPAQYKDGGIKLKPNSLY